jgi:hypothetical protein
MNSSGTNGVVKVTQGVVDSVFANKVVWEEASSIGAEVLANTSDVSSPEPEPMRTWQIKIKFS